MDVAVSALIVNYNGRDLLTRCLRSLRAAAGDLSVETIVVDNGSTDDSLDLVPPELAPTRLIRAGANLGFAKANNEAAAVARGRYWLLINTDCFLEPGALPAMLRRMEDDRRAAVVVPRLHNADGSLQRSCHNFPSPTVFFLEQSSLWKLGADRSWARRFLLANAHDRPMTVDWATGACWLVRPQAWREAAGFDPEFFFYWEETDLCCRLEHLGWQVWFEPAARATHLGGGSSDVPTLLPHFFRGLFRFYRRHYSPPALRAARAIIVALATTKTVLHAAAALVTVAPGPRRQRLASARAWIGVLTERPELS